MSGLDQDGRVANILATVQASGFAMFDLGSGPIKFLALGEIG
jgi:hypothetical protein